jgi:hypothetical protein
MRVRYLTTQRAKELGVNLDNFPNFHRTGSIIGMKKLYYGKNALLVRHGNYIYNVSSRPDIYYAAH